MSAPCSREECACAPVAAPAQAAPGGPVCAKCEEARAQLKADARPLCAPCGEASVRARALRDVAAVPRGGRLVVGVSGGPASAFLLRTLAASTTPPHPSAPRRLTLAGVHVVGPGAGLPPADAPTALAAAAAAAAAGVDDFHIVDVDTVFGGVPGAADALLAAVAPPGAARVRRALVLASLLAAAAEDAADAVATGETATSLAAAAVDAAASGAGAATALAAARADTARSPPLLRPLGGTPGRDVAVLAVLAGVPAAPPIAVPTAAAAVRDARALAAAFVASCQQCVPSTAASCLGALARVPAPVVDADRGICALCGVPLVAGDVCGGGVPCCYPCATLALGAPPALGGDEPVPDPDRVAAVAAVLPAGGLWRRRREE